MDEENINDTEAVENTAEEVVSPSETSKMIDTKKTAIALLVVAVIILGALEISGRTNILAGANTLATVNGEKITESEFNTRLMQILDSPQAQAFNLNDPALRQEVEAQVLNEIINTKLLIQAAVDGGFSVTEAEVDEEYDLIVERLGSETILQEEIEKGGLDSASFRQNVSDQILINKFLDDSIDPTDIAISEEEVSAFYDQISTQEGIPPLSDIEPQIRGQLQSEKQQALIGAIITELKGEATIEINS